MRHFTPRTGFPPPDDAALVARIRSGDGEAFRHLVQRHQDPLFRHALGMTGSPDTASDLVQSAFVRAYTQLHRCREPERFGAWIFRIVVNACKDYLKSRRRRDISLDDGANLYTDPSADPEQDLERSELRSLLEGALAELPEIQREAFLLKHVEGRSYEEIASILDVSVPALKMRVLRAREALKTALEAVR